MNCRLLSEERESLAEKGNDVDFLEKQKTTVGFCWIFSLVGWRLTHTELLICGRKWRWYCGHSMVIGWILLGLCHCVPGTHALIWAVCPLLGLPMARIFLNPHKLSGSRRKRRTSGNTPRLQWEQRLPAAKLCIESVSAWQKYQVTLRTQQGKPESRNHAQSMILRDSRDQPIFLSHCSFDTRRCQYLAQKNYSPRTWSTPTINRDMLQNCRMKRDTGKLISRFRIMSSACLLVLSA